MAGQAGQDIRAWLVRRAGAVPPATILRVQRDGRTLETFGIGPDCVDKVHSEIVGLCRPGDIIAAFTEQKATVALAELEVERVRENASDNLSPGVARVLGSAITAAVREATRGSDRALDALEADNRALRIEAVRLREENDRFRAANADIETRRFEHAERMAQLQIEAAQSDLWMGKAFELGGMVFEDWSLRAKVGAILQSLGDKKPALLAEVMSTIEPGHAKALLQAIEVAEKAKKQAAEKAAKAGIVPKPNGAS